MLLTSLNFKLKANFIKLLNKFIYTHVKTNKKNVFFFNDKLIISVELH